MKKVDRETLNAEIQRIYDRDGQVTAPVVLKESEPEGAPLHHLFEWDDSVAAKEYRLNQARKIIRVSRVTYEGKPQQLVHVSPVNIDQDATNRFGYYQAATVLVETPTEFERAMEEALKALSSARRRVETLEEAARGAGENNTSARVAVALRALETAQEAIRVH